MFYLIVGVGVRVIALAFTLAFTLPPGVEAIVQQAPKSTFICSPRCRFKVLGLMRGMSLAGMRERDPGCPFILFLKSEGENAEN